MQTNSNSRIIAAILADAKIGTFTSIIQKLKGTKRGHRRYGDDTVLSVIFTGFKYDALCQRSLDVLAGLDAEGVLLAMQAKGITTGWSRGDEVPITVQDVQDALDRLQASWTLSRDGENASTNDHVFESLTVDGVAVRGCRVYTGQTDAAKAAGVPAPAKPGTVYLHGLQISRKVLVPAPNGPVPASKSQPRVVAEAFIRDLTPMSKYRSYVLAPGGDFILKAGGTAVLEAEKAGIILTPEVMDAIRRTQAA